MKEALENEKNVTRSISFDPDSLTTVSKVAKAKGISVSAVIRILIKENLKHPEEILKSAR